MRVARKSLGVCVEERELDLGEAAVRDTDIREDDIPPRLALLDFVCMNFRNSMSFDLEGGTGRADEGLQGSSVGGR